MSSAVVLESPRKKHTCSLVTKPARGTGKSEGGMMEARRIARDQPLPLQPLCPTAIGTHRGNVDRQSTYQCTREAVSRRTARLGCIIRRPPPRAGRSPHHGSRQSRAGCPACSPLHVQVRCQGRTGRDDAGPIEMRGGWSSALWSGTHLEAGASHSAMATVSWKPLMRAPLSRAAERRRTGCEVWGENHGTQLDSIGVVK